LRMSLNRPHWAEIEILHKSAVCSQDRSRRVGCQSEIGGLHGLPRCPTEQKSFFAFTDNQRLTKAYQRLTEVLSTTYRSAENLGKKRYRHIHPSPTRWWFSCSLTVQMLPTPTSDFDRYYLYRSRRPNPFEFWTCGYITADRPTIW
jgi:hypothetical protein